MSYLIASFIVLWVLYSIGDHIGNGDCRSTTGFESDLEWLCERCNVITLTWGFMQGHATGDSGDRIVIKKAFPECIAIAGRHGFVPATNNDNMVTLVRTNKKDFTHIHKENAKRKEYERKLEEALIQTEENENIKDNHIAVIGTLIVLVIIVATLFFLRGVSSYYDKNDAIAKEEIIIPADTSIHKITPINEDKFKKTTNKTIAKRNKKSSIKNTIPNETIEEKIEVKDVNHIIDENKIYDVVEEIPIFPGGSSALFEYLNKNIHYPVVAEENGVQGRAVVTFVVECDGSISNAKVVKSVDPSLDIEAKRIVMSMPHWIPAKQNGIAVRCKYTVPVTFRLC